MSSVVSRPAELLPIAVMVLVVFVLVLSRELAVGIWGTLRGTYGLMSNGRLREDD
jgi:hypothetical protein